MSAIEIQDVSKRYRDGTVAVPRSRASTLGTIAVADRPAAVGVTAGQG